MYWGTCVTFFPFGTYVTQNLILFFAQDSRSANVVVYWPTCLAWRDAWHLLYFQYKLPYWTLLRSPAQEILGM